MPSILNVVKKPKTLTIRSKQLRTNQMKIRRCTYTITNLIMATLIVAAMVSSCSENRDPNKNKLKENLTEKEINLSEFSKQEIQLRFDTCSLYLNGNPFSINETITNVKKALGFEYSISQSIYPKRNIYSWFNGALLGFEDESADKIESFTYYFVNDSNMTSTSYIVIQGTPLNSDMTMSEFIDQSDFSWDDVSFGNSSYTIELLQCDKPVKVSFWSEIAFTYSGTGHARVKEGPDLENTKNIRSVSFSSDEP